MKLNPRTFIAVTVVVVQFLMVCFSSRESKTLGQARDSQASAPNGQSPECKEEYFETCLWFQMMRDDEDVKKCGGEALFHLTFVRVDLNRDKKPEYLVKSNGPERPRTNSPIDRVIVTRLCSLGSPKYNRLWVYRKVNGGYQLMLRERRIKSVTPMRTYTNGYRDLKIVAGRWDSSVRKFDGKGYK